MMKCGMVHLLLAILSISLLVALSTLVYAQSSTDYNMTWVAVHSGGGVSSAKAYCLGGTIGQPEAGITSDGVYTLNSGFWSGMGPVKAPSASYIYLPTILRRSSTRISFR